MLVQVNIGGVIVTFGEPYSLLQPAPFYPYLEEVDAISDATGEETANTSFRLTLKAQDLIHINLRRQVVIYNDKLEKLFEGVIGRIAYSNAINITVEA